MLCAKIGWKWPSCFGEEDFLNVGNFFSLFCIITLGVGFGPSFEQTWIPILQGCFMPSLDEIGPMTWRKKIYEKFCYFLIIFPWNKAWSFFWTSLNSHYPRTLRTPPLYGWNIADTASNIIQSINASYQVWLILAQWFLVIFNLNKLEYVGRNAQLFWIFKGYQQKVQGSCIDKEKQVWRTNFRTGQKHYTSATRCVGYKMVRIDDKFWFDKYLF